MKTILCPFFRVDCLRKNCTAYEEKIKYEPIEDFSAEYRVLFDAPYCNALNIYLPFKKEEDVPLD